MGMSKSGLEFDLALQAIDLARSWAWQGYDGSILHRGSEELPFFLKFFGTEIEYLGRS
jgi:hypothetical protein